MSHLYKMVKNTNEKMTWAYNKWYARPVYNGTVDLDWIAERIQRNSTAKKSDAKAVLTPVTSNSAMSVSKMNNLAILLVVLDDLKNL